MLKKGFTLAEVLITLGIVGVVAALTAPALVMSSRNEANAAKLAVVVSNLENAFQNAIAQEGVDNLYGTRMWANEVTGGAGENVNRSTFVGELGRYMVLSGFGNRDREYYGNVKTCPMSENGATAPDDSCVSGANAQRFGGQGDMFPLFTKNGATIFIRTYRNNNARIAEGRAAAIPQGCTYYTNAADVVIDVNGLSAPNTFGRDIFWFQVGENGVLYPNGGRDIARLEVPGGTWDGEGWYACTDANKGNRSDLRGIGCTARLIHDSYKMNY